MGPVSALLLTICLANLVSSQSTEMDSGQCEQSNAVIYDIAEDGKAMGADIRRLREELERHNTVIEEIRQMLKKVNFTNVNVSVQHSPEEFRYCNSNLGSCYFISKTELNWNDAVEDCIDRGSYLAEIQSKEENDYLIPLTASNYHWIGGNNIVTEDVWVWRNSGERFTFTNGFQPENLNRGYGYRCLQVSPKGYWRCSNCSYKKRYICERESH